MIEYINNQPVVDSGTDDIGSWIKNSLGEKYYECMYCGGYVREGESSHGNGYVCQLCGVEI